MIALADPQNITDVLGQGQALYCDLGWTDLVRNEPAAFPAPQCLAARYRRGSRNSRLSQ